MSRISSDPPPDQAGAQRGGQGLVRGLPHPQGGADGGRDERRVGQRPQLDEDDALGHGGRRLGGDGQGQSGLADAAGAGQGDQTGLLVAQQPDDLGQVASRPRSGSAGVGIGGASEPGARGVLGRAGGAARSGRDRAAPGDGDEGRSAPRRSGPARRPASGSCRSGGSA